MEEQERQFKGIWIPSEIWLTTELSLQEKVVLVEIDSLEDEVKGCFASNKYFANFFKLSPGRISQIITNLSKKQYIEVSYVKEGKEILERQIRIKRPPYPLVNKLNTYLENDKGGIKKTKGGYLENDKDNNIKTNNININNKKEIYKESCKKVITRLNELNGTKYSTTSEANLKFIKGRMQDGYTEEDLLLVVEKMSYLWHQPNEKDMTPYLRPSTLFRPTNFENYLNMPVKVKKTTKNVKLDLDILNKKGD
jgi:uncharacterized phage protein (TIGR02220 family)